MATEAFAHGTTPTGAHVVASVITREAGQWMMARASDGLEATFSVEVDERYWRVRRAHGATASMLETALPAPLSAGDLTAAIARWASGAGLTVRTSCEDGAWRITLTRHAD